MHDAQHERAGARAHDDPEMIAMASYLRSLGASMPAMGAAQRKAHEPGAFKTPDSRGESRRAERKFSRIIARRATG